MGRAFRVLKRTAHLTVQVAERPEKIKPVGAAGETTTTKKRRGARPAQDAGQKSTKKAKE